MISIIITAWKEQKTIKKAIRNITAGVVNVGAGCSCPKISYEILLVCPDEETANAGLSVSEEIKWVRDSRQGKPAALNMAFRQAQGKILVLTDGDVFVDKQALPVLLDHFKDSEVGLVTGRPLSMNPRNNILGYWSHLLVNAAHKKRLAQYKNQEYLDASGYLLAFRKKLVRRVPKYCLVEDAYISQKVWEQGYKIAYEPGAQVYVKYPTNFKDWLIQKKRSAGGYLKSSPMRGFSRETRWVFFVLKYAENITELFWSVLLVFARLYLWLLIFWERKILKKSFKKTWLRVETTK